MQNKIDEIMGLVNDYAEDFEFASSGYNQEKLEKIKSKLRELVREPLTHELVWSIAVIADSRLDAIRKAERAHNITWSGHE